MHVLSKLRARLWYKGPALNMERGRDGGESVGGIPKFFCTVKGGGGGSQKISYKKGFFNFFPTGYRIIDNSYKYFTIFNINLFS